ncbi:MULTISPECIES: carbohydrate ABC transporter permease [Streptomyces]|uniref:Sugar ABC transporter permease n=9 Tax=Streptomyces TaxID=1883 RepID=A0A8A1UM46_STRR1|nr:ABC transporter permease subunit [Streptomyces sp. SID5471]QDA09774.1 sugar ABC transporter permease [Streptomyces rimosus]QGY64665.1 ABC transporter permease subunit [Streptomyces rimosus R6-500]QST81603.1 sugar ABC transporter permease [Streptomyces rimosus subsp. rimosus ATCC 10970]QTL88489.1 sugar ABC transporter permease [Streptomyces rimosus subsp. rimosus]
MDDTVRRREEAPIAAPHVPEPAPSPVPAPSPAPAALTAPAPRRAKSPDTDPGLPHRRWWTPYLFLLPGLVMVVLFSLWPFVNTVILSLTDAQILKGGRFVGLENYGRALGDPDFWTATVNSVVYLAVVVPCLVLLPLALAVLVQRKIPGIGFFRSAFYTPVIASAVVVGLIWQWVLRSDGLVNTVFEKLHLISGPVPFLTDSTMLLVSAMIVTIWKGLGYYMVFYLAALGNVPTSLYEAAALDGAGAVRRFLSITIPSVKPMMLLVGTLSAISALRVFTEIYILGGESGGPGGGARTLPFLIRQVGLGFAGETGYAAAISILLFLLTLVFSLLGHRLSKGDER